MQMAFLMCAKAYLAYEGSEFKDDTLTRAQDALAQVRTCCGGKFSLSNGHVLYWLQVSKDVQLTPSVWN